MIYPNVDHREPLFFDGLIIERRGERERERERGKRLMKVEQSVFFSEIQGSQEVVVNSIW